MRGRTLLVMTLLGVAPGVLAQDAGSAAQDPAVAETIELSVETAQIAPDCGGCHSRRERLFKAGAHGTLDLGCLDCHSGGLAGRSVTEHVQSGGREPAPYPRNYPRAEAVSLCSSCHDPQDETFFVSHERMDTGQSCLDCHSFHELTRVLEQRDIPRQSHGVIVRSHDEVHRLGPFRVEGLLAVGARGVKGNSRQYRDQVNLEPGVQLVAGEIRGVNTGSSVGIDRFSARVDGWGDPHVFGEVTLESTGSWQLKLRGDRYEDRFDPTSELHESESVRKIGVAEVLLELSPDTRLQIGFERFTREDDRILSRYLDVSNARFQPTFGDRREVADLAWVRVDGHESDWDWSVRQGVRWRREEDDRFLKAENVPADDFEDFDGSSRTLTPTTDLQASGRLLDGRMRVDAEAFIAFSEKHFDADSLLSGTDAGGLAYTGSFETDGSARSRYGRLELGTEYEVNERLAAALRVRYRNSRGNGRLYRVDTISTAAGPVVTVADTQYRYRTLDVEALTLSRVTDWLDLDLGYGVRLEDIDVRGTTRDNASPDTHGVLCELRARGSERLSLKAGFRAFTTHDPYTEITPDRQARAHFTVEWQPSDLLRLGGGHSASRTELAASADSHSDIDVSELWVTIGDTDDPLSLRFGVSHQDYETKVDTIAQVSGFPVPYEARFSGDGWRYSVAGFIMLLDRVRVTGGWDFADVSGDNDYRKHHGYVAAEWNLHETRTVRFSTDFYDLDDPESAPDDFESTVFQITLEQRF